MNTREIIETYFHSIETSDIETIVRLFAAGAVVHSPLYGDQPFENFFINLFDETSGSAITLLDLFENANNPLIAAAHFKYEWALKNGNTVNFEGVDIFRFNDDGQIQDMTIIYDTSQARTAL